MYQKNLQQRVKNFLEDEPLARERKNKNRVNRAILVEMYPELQDIDIKRLTEAVRMSQSIDRAWRKVTEIHPHLRGKDYWEKFELEESARLSLGYPR